MSELQNWEKENRTSIANKIVLFIISPFISLLYSLKSINTKSSFVVIFLFSICFGMAFSVSNVRTEKNSADGVSYRSEFEQYCLSNGLEYYYGLSDFLSFNGETKDYYFDTVAFYVSRITNNYHVMFFVFSIVFAFFQLKSLKYLALNKYFTSSILCLLLFIFFTWNQIFNINGMRFWTAAWIGVFCVFKIFYDKKNKYFFLALVTPFFHGSYWIFIGVICIGMLFSRFEKIWIILFIISMIVSNGLLEFVQNYEGYLPTFLENSVSAYTNADYVYERFEKEGTGFWFVGKIFDAMEKIYINILVLMLIFNKNRSQISKNEIILYRFLLILATFVNFGYSIPSLGGRYVLLSYPLIAFLWLYFFKGKRFNWLIYIFPLVFFMSIYYEILLYASVTDLFFYISSPFILIPQYLFL